VRRFGWPSVRLRARRGQDDGRERCASLAVHRRAAARLEAALTFSVALLPVHNCQGAAPGPVERDAWARATQVPRHAPGARLSRFSASAGFPTRLPCVIIIFGPWSALADACGATVTDCGLGPPLSGPLPLQVAGGLPWPSRSRALLPCAPLHAPTRKMSSCSVLLVPDLRPRQRRRSTVE